MGVSEPTKECAHNWLGCVGPVTQKGCPTSSPTGALLSSMLEEAGGSREADEDGWRWTDYAAGLWPNNIVSTPLQESGERTDLRLLRTLRRDEALLCLDLDVLSKRGVLQAKAGINCVQESRLKKKVVFGVVDAVGQLDGATEPIFVGSQAS
jgi:hypothetical protein